MTHDPLCPDREQMVWGPTCTDCDLIARVREDERGKNFQIDTVIGNYRAGYADALRDAVEAVKALPWTHDMWVVGYERKAIVAAIEALGGDHA